MEFRLRLVPVALLAAVGLLGLKLADAWLAFDAPAHAQSAPETPAKPAAGAPPTAIPPAAAPAAPAPDKAAAPAAAAGKPAAAPQSGPDKPQALDPGAISPSEVELLQKLADRRAELDKRAAELSQREVLLQAAEKRIDDKIAKLTALEKDIGGIVDKHSEEDEARIKSLVKIYETMKPTDAARIFTQLDMPVLLGVLEHMKERNAAPILAAMEPGKAKAVTLALAERRDQRDKGDAAADKAAPANDKAATPAAKP
jgi:flagellar motility protein MotE (MotC chaperone)